MNEKLPIVNTISYSGLSDWQLCSFYYKLVNIDRLKPWKNTVDTVFGQYVHKGCQDILQDKITIKAATKDFERKWKKFCGIYKLDDFLPLSGSATKIFSNIKKCFKKQFGKYKIIKVEKRLSEVSSSRWPQQFKGFIDIVLEKEDGKIVIIDLKTSDSAYSFTRYKDKYKDYQLVLYKHFYCIENKMNPENVETYFIVLEKDVNSKDPANVVRITSGSVKIKNALEWLESALTAINNKLFVKDFFSCRKYGEKHPCVFLSSPHCRNKKLL